MVRPPFSVSTRQCACISALLSLVLIVLAWAGPAKAPVDQRETVVAIGDVHGDFDDFVTILQRAGGLAGRLPWFKSGTCWIGARSRAR